MRKWQEIEVELRCSKRGMANSGKKDNKESVGARKDTKLTIKIKINRKNKKLRKSKKQIKRKIELGSPRESSGFC